MNRIQNKMLALIKKTNSCAPRRVTRWLAVSALSILFSVSVNAQVLNKIEPMGDWAEYITVQYDGKPLQVHLRTGYERALIFPEPVALYAINNRATVTGSTPSLPNCRIEIDTDVMGFSPLQRFKQQRVSVRGIESGIVYELIVSSSPTGRRQPIQMIKQP